jgi:periplasmic protein TonB
MAEARDRRPMNGARGVHVLAAASGASPAYDDPMTKVFGLDAQASGPLAWVGYFLGAIALLLGLMVSARAIALVLALNEPMAVASPPPQEIDVVRDELPPPPPPEPEAKSEPAPPPRATPHEAPPPPAPAQAGKVLTQEPDPNEPVDLTGNTIISGNAEAYAGGVTASNGTSKNAVRGLTSPSGVPGGTGKPQPSAPPGPDRSRAPSLANGLLWSDCPFPPEADTAQIDEAYVTIEVNVRTDGTPARAAVLSDPGNGFGRETVRCALARRYNAALDHDGNPIAAGFKVRIHFTR